VRTVGQFASRVTSVPSRMTCARFIGAVATGGLTVSFIQWRHFGSMNTTGSSEAIDSRSSEYASAGFDGVTTVRPGVEVQRSGERRVGQERGARGEGVGEEDKQD